MHLRKMACAIVALACATPAFSEDKLFDATSASSVAASLQEAGYKALVKTGADGDPYILSSANGEDFTIEFYGCKDGHCSSLQFTSWYKAEPLWTPALTNEWNSDKRFLRIGIDNKGQLHEYLDLTVTGKLTQANFADWVDWYQVMDTSLNKFIAEKRAAAKK